VLGPALLHKHEAEKPRVSGGKERSGEVGLMWRAGWVGGKEVEGGACIFGPALLEDKEKAKAVSRSTWEREGDCGVYVCRNDGGGRERR
jgi:hypothetical protein